MVALTGIEWVKRRFQWVLFGLSLSFSIWLVCSWPCRFATGRLWCDRVVTPGLVAYPVGISIAIQQTDPILRPEVL
jgi:hypothetical protein